MNHMYMSLHLTAALPESREKHIYKSHENEEKNNIGEDLP